MTPRRHLPLGSTVVLAAFALVTWVASFAIALASFAFLVALMAYHETRTLQKQHLEFRNDVRDLALMLAELGRLMQVEAQRQHIDRIIAKYQRPKPGKP